MSDPALTALAPRVAIERWKRGELAPALLTRCLLAHASWSVPVSEDAVGEMLADGPARLSLSRDDRGVARLLTFSDDEASRAYAAAVGDAEERFFLTVRGTWLFALELPDVDGVVVDPTTPHEVSYSREQLAGMRAVAAALEVEAALAALRAGTGVEGLPLVRGYPGYILGVRRTGDSLQLAAAPDDEGRVWAAAFTADDAYRAFESAAAEAGQAEGLEPLPMTGEQLFTQLTRLTLDGVVFNCAGPPALVAFTPKFSRVVLSA